MNGDDVVQAYIQYPKAESMPLKELKAFKRVNVNKGEEEIVEFKIPVNELMKWDLEKKQWRLYAGEYKILFGGNSQEVQLSVGIKVKG